MDMLATEIWEFCLDRGIFLKAEWIPGSEMGNTDRLSRIRNTPSEWKLKTSIFNEIEKMWGPHNIDLFAAKENTQLTRYYSMYKDQDSLGQDCFLADWNSGN